MSKYSNSATPANHSLPEEEELDDEDDAELELEPELDLDIPELGPPSRKSLIRCIFRRTLASALALRNSIARILSSKVRLGVMPLGGLQ